jgi:hypothetical protein
MDRALRDHLRSSVNHNTVTIDGSSSCGASRSVSLAVTSGCPLEVARRNPRFALIEACHDAYRDVSHRRVVLASQRGYLVADQIAGTGSHEASQHWHFEPRWRVGCESPHALRLDHESGASAHLLFERGE